MRVGAWCGVQARLELLEDKAAATSSQAHSMVADLEHERQQTSRLRAEVRCWLSSAERLEKQNNWRCWLSLAVLPLILLLLPLLWHPCCLAPRWT